MMAAKDPAKKREAWLRYYAKSKDKVLARQRERYHETKQRKAAQTEMLTRSHEARSALSAVEAGAVPATKAERIAAIRAANSAKMRKAMGIDA
jgi:hypothetical protein